MTYGAFQMFDARTKVRSMTAPRALLIIKGEMSRKVEMTSGAGV